MRFHFVSVNLWALDPDNINVMFHFCHHHLVRERILQSSNITCSYSTALSFSNHVTRLLDYYEKIQTDDIPMHNAVPAAHPHGVEFGKFYSRKTNILECIAACLYSGSSAQHTRSISHLGSKRVHRNRKCSFLTVPARRPEPMSSCHVVSVAVSSSDILSLVPRAKKACSPSPIPPQWPFAGIWGENTSPYSSMVQDL